MHWQHGMIYADINGFSGMVPCISIAVHDSSLVAVLPDVSGLEAKQIQHLISSRGNGPQPLPMIRLAV